jgi:hypothetical protein
VSLFLNPSGFRHWVDLGDDDPDTARVYSPARVKCAIRPASPGPFDEQKITHVVEMRYQPNIGFNTRITHDDRQLYVRGMQDVDEAHRMLVLLCEEVRAA